MNQHDANSAAASIRDGGRFPASLAPATRSIRLARFAPWTRALACLLSGLLLTAAFPPLEWSWIAWIAVLPALLAAPATDRRGRIACGALFGLSHCLTLFGWLNEVGFFAGFLLGSVIAVFPAMWYVAIAKYATTDIAPAPRRWQSWLRELARVLLPAALWVTLEWIRSWLFTGLPWGFAGISQWRQPLLLPLATVTGVYGISFLILLTNLSLARLRLAVWRRQHVVCELRGAVAAAVLLLTVVAPWGAARLYPTPVLSERTVRIAAVQGNIPQSRGRGEQMLPVALEAYDRVSRSLVRTDQPDLLLWPETAVPAALRYSETYASMVETLCRDTRTPLLMGTIDYRFPSAHQKDSETGNNPNTDVAPLGFNSAFLLGPSGQILEHYDKMHLVPFGEYTPFEEQLPILRDWIGMGRSLTAGREPTLLRLPGGIRAGVNICYEDCFPGISRTFTRRGAEVLLTLTNDAWYAQSAGSRQHMIHAVFRAVENRRPLMRSGNNSDTCLIQADGSVEGLLYDEDSGNRFIRAGRTYPLRVPQTLPLTFYTRFGDVFALLCLGATLACAFPALFHFLHRKQRLYTLIRGMPPPPF
ncbi:MAG: apolipoprotein N-acyltransferase [Verrucomicrobiota bacterium]